MDEETLDGLLIYAEVTSRNIWYVKTIATNLTIVSEKDFKSAYTSSLINCLNEYISNTCADMERLHNYIIDLRNRKIRG